MTPKANAEAVEQAKLESQSDDSKAIAEAEAAAKALAAAEEKARFVDLWLILFRNNQVCRNEICLITYLHTYLGSIKISL